MELRAPLPEAGALTGPIAFVDEPMDVVLDGERRVSPATLLSAAILEEAGVGSR